MSEKNEKNEIDFYRLLYGLNDLFDLFKKGAKNFLYSIIKFLFFIFDSIVKYKYIAILSAIIIGACLIYFESKKPILYTNTMLVETNFSSSVQLYRLVDNLNNLSKLSDKTDLEKEFNGVQIASSAIVTLDVEPYYTLTDQSKLIKEYLENINSSSSATSTNNVDNLMSLDQIQSKIKPTEYKKHLITVMSKDNSVFKPLQEYFLATVSNYDYLKEKQGNSLSNYKIEKGNNEITLEQLEELRILYEYEIKSKADEKRQVLSSSSVMFAPEQDNIDREAPLKVINKIMLIQKNIGTIDSEVQENGDIIKVISGFNIIGETSGRESITYLVFKSIIMSLLLVVTMNIVWRLKKLRYQLKNHQI